MGMRIHERQRHSRELVVGLDAQVSHGDIRHAIHAHALQPLQQGARNNHRREFDQQRGERDKINPARTQNHVDAATDENRRIELQHHACRRACKRGNQRHSVRTNICQQATRDLSRRHPCARDRFAIGTGRPLHLIQALVAGNCGGDGSRAGRGCVRIRHETSPPPQAQVGMRRFRGRYRSCSAALHACPRPRPSHVASRR